MLEARHLPRGIAHVVRDANGGASAAFERAFDEACGDWVRANPTAPVLACGMVGSREGWREAPYLEVPVRVDRLASALVTVGCGDATIHIVPGLVERGRPPDVMRGEETQIAGVCDGDGSILVGLPGTHSKWAEVRGRAVVHFDTFMTGEVYELLCAHSMLGRTMKRGSGWDLDAFDRGARVARTARAGVLASMFSTRSLALVESLPAEAQADYLSGLLIGHELRGLEELDRHALDAERIVLAGGEELCRRYRRVLAGMGRREVEVARHATARGLWSIARAAGLVDDTSGGSLRESLSRCGLVAILRGIQPGEAEAAGAALYAAGLRAVEVPLNSPDPLASIRALRGSLPADCAVGAGTVMSAAQVDDVRAAGGEFIVMPHADPAVIRAAREAGLEVAPGVATAGEAFAAIAAGADLLKMFPASELGAATLAAWRAVLPGEVQVIPVGGVGAADMAKFVAAGAAGFGLGSAVYRPGMPPDEIGSRAAAMVAAWRAVSER